MLSNDLDNLIKDALDCEYIQSIYIDKFTIEDLEELSEKAKKNNILISLKTEHSNFAQGTLVQLIKKEFASSLLKYL